MALFGLFGSSAPKQQAPVTGPQPVSTWDVFLDTFLGGGTPARNRMQLEAAQMARYQQQQDFANMQRLNGALYPQTAAQPAPQAAPAPAPKGPIGPEVGGGFGTVNAAPQMPPEAPRGVLGGQGPSAAPSPAPANPAAPAANGSTDPLRAAFYKPDGTFRPYNEVAQNPLVMQLIMAGGTTGAKVKTLLDSLKDSREEWVQGPGDRMVSKYDPTKFGPEGHKMPEGATAVYDANGNVVDMRPMSGYANYKGVVSRAEADGRNASEASYAGTIAERRSAGNARGQAPYTPDNRTDASGRPVYGVVGDRFGGQTGGPMAGQGLTGQSPSEATIAGEQGKQEVAQTQAWRDKGSQAGQMLGALRRAQTLGQQVTTGALTTPNAVYGTADALGIKLPLNLGAAQAYQALSNEMAMRLRGDLPKDSQMSNADRQFYENMVPSVGKTPEGNRKIIEMAIPYYERQQFLAQKRAEWDSKIGVGRKNSAGLSFDEWVGKYNNANPIWAGRK